MSNQDHSPSMPPACRSCGASLASNSAFCEHCGVQVASSYPTSDPISHGRLSAPKIPSSGPSKSFLTSGADPAANPLLGAPSPNQTYLGNRLSYSDLPTNFDPISNPAYRQVLLSQFLATLAAWIIGSVMLFLIFGIAAIVQILSSLSSSGLDPESSGALFVIWNAAWGALTIVLFCFFAFRRLSVQLTEWMLTVDGRATAAHAALEHMYAIIYGRQTPVRSIRVVRLAAPRQQPRDYLELDENIFTGFVSSFGFGSDLFIGWSFWLNLSPARWWIMSLRRMFTGEGSGIYGSLMYDEPKAMREVMHSAVRQGVDMATGNTRPLGQGIIGGTVAVESISL